MPDRLTVLLDQNIPKPVASWLTRLKPSWTVYHTSDVELSGKTDEEVFAWAQRNGAVIISFDEDFADGRSFSSKDHHGIVRLRVWPTTIEETEQALERLFDEVPPDDLGGSLVIIDRSRIRVRSRPK